MSIISGAQPYAWKPKPGSFDSLNIYLIDDLFVEVINQTSLPLELGSALYDLAGMYAPLVIVTEIPSAANGDEDVNQIVFYQHLEVCNLGQMLQKLNELEVGWKLEGFALISPRKSSLKAEDVQCIATECQLSKPLPSVPDQITTDQAATVSSVNVPWKPIVFGLTCFALGCLSSLLLW